MGDGLRALRARCGGSDDRGRVTSSGVSPPSSVNLVTGLLTMAVCLAGCSASSSGPASSSAVSGTTPASQSGSSRAASPGWIVYQSNDGLALVRQDGSGGHPLLVDQSIAWNHPDWSPDLVTLVRSPDDYNLATIHADGTGLTDLVDPKTGVADRGGAHPRWSPIAT